MSKENNANRDLVLQIKSARDALDAALAILTGTSVHPRKKQTAKTERPSRLHSGALDFTMPIRAFVKKYSGGMNGAKKFTLLVAYLCGGDLSKTVNLADVEAQWNRMTAKGLLGMKFNRLYSSEARDNDWAAAAKTGVYSLRPSWKAIFDA
ncbi:MAG: hypothetical protein K9G60_14905 [Pseudolabrys sp.]|nr:hypothetical protein [Pseudolabrys sp.]